MVEITETDGIVNNVRMSVDVHAESAFVQFWKYKQYRTNVFRSLSIGGCLLCTGLFLGQGGATLMDIQILTHTNIQEASAFFSAYSIGSLIGSLSASPVIPRVNHDILMATCLLFLGGISVVTPYCPYSLVITVMALEGGFIGVMDTAGMTEHMRIWREKGTVLSHVIQFGYALGNALAPFYVEPFLAPLNTCPKESLANVSVNAGGSGECYHNDTRKVGLQHVLNKSQVIKDNISSSGNLDTVVDATYVRNAFLITGVLCWTCTIPFIIMYFVVSSEKMTEIETHNRVSHRELSKPFYTLVVACLIIIIYAYGMLICLFTGFFFSFTVRHFSGVTKSMAAYATGIHGLSFAGARLFMVGLSSLLKEMHLFGLCCIFMSVSFTCLTLSAVYGNITIFFVFTGLSGFSKAAVLPSGLTWAEAELIKLTPPVLSSVYATLSVSFLISPVLVAFFMESFSNLWFCYLLFIAVGMISTTFVFLLVLNRKILNVRFGYIRHYERI